MANTSLAVLNALGATVQIDAEAIAGGDLRQVIVFGDKSVEAAVVAVVNGPQAAGAYGLTFRRAPLGTPFNVNAANGTNAQVVKNSAGVVHAVSGFNKASAPRYLKFYDKASTPNPASDTPVWVVGCQAGLPFSDAPPPGVAFTNGIAIVIVTGIAATDTGATTLDDLVVNIFKE